VTPTPCPRLFEVEAMRDGRLAGTELMAFGRHVASCAACTREARALEALSEKVRAASGEPEGSDELRALRERTRLLAAFDGTLLVPEKRARGRRLLLSAALAGLVAVSLISGLKRQELSRPRPLNADIRPEAQAVWAERIEGDSRHVVLSRGSLRIHVDHEAGQGRFLVLLPDGELEDRGTTFTVSAAEGHTTRVVVEEGSVVLRLADRLPVTLGAGQTWTREVPLVASPSSLPPMPAAQTPATSALAMSAPVASQIARHRAAVRPRAGALSPPSPSLDAPTEQATSDFRAAMALFETGAHHEAAAQFARFVQVHGSDPRAEDAAYLQVVALRRGKSDEEARRAAEDYLGRYPNGFRRAEIAKLFP